MFYDKLKLHYSCSRAQIIWGENEDEATEKDLLNLLKYLYSSAMHVREYMHVFFLVSENNVISCTLFDDIVAY